MSLIAYGLIALAILGSLGGIAYGLDHRGYERGKGEVKQAWDKANKKATDEAEAERKRQDALRQEQDKKATERLANEKKRTAGLMVSLEAHIKASGVSAQCPLPLVLLNDWNISNAGPKGVGTGTVSPERPKPSSPR